MVSIQAQDKDLGKIDVFCYKVSIVKNPSLYRSVV